MRDYYTRYPRPVLWLVPGDEPGIEPFYLSTLPITNEQYEACDPDFERSPRSPGDRDPAIGLSWEEAEAYCRWYAELARKPIRLPGEEEWEHACRGGSAGLAFWGDDPDGADRFAWHAGNTPGDRLPELGAKDSNPFGLYAMLGGVWEWTAERTLRGGSVDLPPEQLAADLTRHEPPGQPVADAGFRIARSLR